MKAASTQSLTTRDRLGKSVFCQSAKILKNLLMKMIIAAGGGEGGERRLPPSPSMRLSFSNKLLTELISFKNLLLQQNN